MGFLDILCDGHGIAGPSPTSIIGGMLSSACSFAGDAISSIADSAGSNVFDGIANTSKKIKSSAPKDIPGYREGLKLEDVVNEDNVHMLPKEAPGWWTANGGTWEEWAMKILAESEHKAYTSTHSDSKSSGSSSSCGICDFYASCGL